MIKDDPEVPNRLLGMMGNDGGWDNAPLVVLTVVCLVFCLIWIPMIFRCRCPHLLGLPRNSDADSDREADALRVSIENLRRLASETGIANRGSYITRRSHPLQHLSPDERKEFLNNILVTKRIINVSKEVPTVNDGESEDDLASKSCAGGTKTTLVLADVGDGESTTKMVEVEPCSICLNDYTEGDILCWSQNSKCQHAFHKDCAMEWLMQSTECPLCRNNYLSLDGDNELAPPDNGDDNNDGAPILTIPGVLRMINTVSPDDTVTFLRSMHLLYLLSQLQAIDDSPTDNQGLEMNVNTGWYRSRRRQQEETRAIDREPASDIQLNSLGPTSASDQANDESV